MELWIQIIIEWVNCLDLLDTPIKELKELEDGNFYRQFISLLPWTTRKKILKKEDIVTKFIQDEYPKFEWGEDSLDGNRHLYLASLFILCTSQVPIFHSPMCTKLQHESQIRIKTFLEMIIPQGKDITKQMLKDAIIKFEDITPKTPMTPRTQALKNFFNSPVARSAHSYKIMTERHRELRNLKSELETEKFEKFELQEDLRIIENKLHNLQEKLQEKISEIKALKEEKMRQRTPQSCKKKNNSANYEQFYRKEINHLEDQLSQRQCEIDKLEKDNDFLSKRLACKERDFRLLKEELMTTEKFLENVQFQGEIKDRELVNLRMTNEELRTYLKLNNKTSIEEQSFEMDGVAPLHSSVSSLNNSEVLSSVIDIQLQEAKEESASLKNQLDSLNKQLDSITLEHNKIAELNANLQEKSSMLQGVQTELNTALDKLSASQKDLEFFRQEKESLVNSNKHLESLCTSQKESLLHLEKSKNVLHAEVQHLQDQTKDLKQSLHNEQEKTVKSNAVLAEMQSQMNECTKLIQNITNESNSLKASIEFYDSSMKKILLRSFTIADITNEDIDNKIPEQLVACLETALGTFEQKNFTMKKVTESLKTRIEEKDVELQQLRLQNSELDEKCGQIIVKMCELQENHKDDFETFNDLISIVQQPLKRVSNLVKLEAKFCTMVEQLSKYKKELNTKNDLLEKLQMCVTILKQEFDGLLKELHLKKEKICKELNKQRIENHKSFEIIMKYCKVVCSSFIEEQSSRKKLEDKLTNSEKLLADSQSTNSTLENNLYEKQKEMEELKIKVGDLKKQLDDSEQNLEKLKNSKLALEEKYEEKLSNNQDTNTKLENELSEKQKEMKDLKVELMSLKEKLENSTQNVEDLKNSKQELEKKQEKELANSQDGHIKLKNDLFEKQKQNDVLKVELEDLKEKWENSEKNTEELKNSKLALEEKYDKELANSQDSNRKLESDLLEKQKEIDDLKVQLTALKEKLKFSTRDMEQLKNTIKSLEEKYRSVLIEKDESLALLTSKSETTLHDLKCLTDKYNLDQQEVTNIQREVESKNDRINSLCLEITSLKTEMEHLISTHQKKESKTKGFIEQLETQILEKQRSYELLSLEAKSKDASLELMKDKLEKQIKETVATELKMKEIILNLQEVRTNQSAILTTQEEALKEKEIHFEQIQKEFNKSKISFCKQLEDEKSLNRNLRSAHSELQIEMCKQIKTIEELKEILKRQRNELEANKEHRTMEDTRMLEIANICKELEHSITELKFTIVKATPKDCDTIITCEKPCTNNENKVDSIRNIIAFAAKEVNASHELILHLLHINTSLNETLCTQQQTVQNKSEELQSLQNKIAKLDNTEQKRVKHLKNLIQQKESLRTTLQGVIKSREDLDITLNTLQQIWNGILKKFSNIFNTGESVSDELKHIQALKAELDSTISKYNICHMQNIKPVNTILWQNFLWIEQKLWSIYFQTKNEETSSRSDFQPDTADNNFSDEKMIIDAQVEKNTILQEDITRVRLQIEDFSNLVAAFEINYDETKFQSELEKKLQSTINELMVEKCEMSTKLDCLRNRNAKLEENINELRNSVKDFEHLQNDLELLKEENSKLREEKLELLKCSLKEDTNNQLKEIHNRYEHKLNEIKQKMKMAYNEQVIKLNAEQEKCLQDRLQSLQSKMEQQCRKQADEISKYKAHVSEISAQIWNIGEKLLMEQQQNEQLRSELKDVKTELENLRKVFKYDKRLISLKDIKEKVTPMPEVKQEPTTYEKRCSIKNIQKMGNPFNAEDEQGEVFDNTYLTDIKSEPSFSLDPDRVSILKQRNALCKPHLKSSYPAEMQFHQFTEDEIKTGSTTEDIFNDSLSQSLLPEQKTKKKDRSQTSYKKPGPPTPSKNGGRLSLQGNELKSPNSRVLKERNKERTTNTPRTLKRLFSSKRQDENIAVSPKDRRRSSFFRKYRGPNDR